MALPVPFVPLVAPEDVECREAAAAARARGVQWACGPGKAAALLWLAAALLATTAVLAGLSYQHSHEGAAAEPVSAAIIEPVTAWFFVRHDMKPGMADAYWKAESAWDPEEFHKLSARVGFHIHSLMPVGRDGPIFAIWEGEAGSSAHGLEVFLEAEVGKFLRTQVFLIDARLITGPMEASSSFAARGAPAAISMSSENGGESRFAVVQGDFKEGKAPSYWRVFLPPDFSYTPESKREAMAPLIKMGFYVSAFMPISVKGPIFGVWEIKAGIDDVGFQEFLDTSLGEWMTFAIYDVNTSLTAGRTPFPRHLGAVGSTTAA